MELPFPPDAGVRKLGFNVKVNTPVASAGKTTLRPVTLSKPYRLVTVRVVVSEDPCFMLIEVSDDVRVKSLIGGVGFGLNAFTS